MEDGNVVSQMAGVITMIFVFVMVLALLAFAKLVNYRMGIDNTVRNYLYVAEQKGYLSSDDIDAFRASLESIGCYDVTINATTAQVPYGSEVTVGAQLKFDNPIWESFSKDTHDNWFALNVARPVEYTPVMRSTARW